MYYWVIGADGQRYGPADIDTLVAWAGEQRINASTILIERGTERQLAAESLTAVAAAIRRLSNSAEAVVVERDPPGLRETVTATRLPTDVQGPPEAGVQPSGIPPIPPVPPIPPGSPYPAQTPHAPFSSANRSPKSKLVAGLLGIFLGWLGIHRFYLGYTGIGLLMLFLSVGGGALSLACLPGAGCGIIWLWGFVEGIICLCGGIRDSEGREFSD